MFLFRPSAIHVILTNLILSRDPVPFTRSIFYFSLTAIIAKTWPYFVIIFLLYRYHRYEQKHIYNTYSTWWYDRPASKKRGLNMITHVCMAGHIVHIHTFSLIGCIVSDARRGPMILHTPTHPCLPSCTLLVHLSLEVHRQNFGILTKKDFKHIKWHPVF